MCPETPHEELRCGGVFDQPSSQQAKLGQQLGRGFRADLDFAAQQASLEQHLGGIRSPEGLYDATSFVKATVKRPEIGISMAAGSLYALAVNLHEGMDQKYYHPGGPAGELLQLLEKYDV